MEVRFGLFLIGTGFLPEDGRDETRT